ncbi:phosphatase 1E [Thraustotheca clavata]|uniref:Phosphatase 1E n=1 Tax=Thraustotheca clavata TaxID=74557 RepID=A0A1V9ZZI8_9STRA|nr:phosphatase 1E [Thraustotheca clavata]
MDEEEAWGVPAVSSSYVCPRPWQWEQYNLTSNKEGNLEKQSQKDRSVWKSRWVVLRDNVLTMYKSKSQVPSSSPYERMTEKSIPLDLVASIGTAKEYGPSAFQIKLHEDRRTYIFRADTKDHTSAFVYTSIALLAQGEDAHMNDWLFEFQCCIANLISVIIRSRSDGRPRLSSSFTRQIDTTRRQNRSQSFDYRDISRFDGQLTLQQLMTQNNVRHSIDSSASSNQVRSPPAGMLFPLEDMDIEATVEETQEFMVVPPKRESMPFIAAPAPLPELTQCISPPTQPKKKYIPPHLRKGYAAPEPVIMSEQPLPAPLDYTELCGTSSMEGNSVYGATSLLGKRSRLEDVICCIPEYHRPHQSIYALFDGHDGDAAALYAREKLPLYLHNHPLFESDWRAACHDVFVRLDNEFLASPRATAGTTASLVVLRGNKLLTANAGDSKAVISNAGKAEDIIKKQTPERADEMERITKAGGWVNIDKELHMSKLHQMDLNDPYIQQKAERVVQLIEIYRVNGELSVSRAIGDIDYKRPNEYKFWMYPEDHPRIFTDRLLIPDPEFQELEITPNMEFLVLACDGLWDTITSQEAVDIVRSKVKLAWSMQDISYYLAELAIRSGSMDNVTVVITMLNPLKKA